jgi:hypothetical protein
MIVSWGSLASSSLSEQTFSTPAWLLIGLFRSEPGTLALTSANSTLTFVSETKTLFEVPISSLSGIRFPWYYFGAGVQFSIDGERYRFSFMEQGEPGSIPEGRSFGRQWKSKLTQIEQDD